MKYLQLAPIIIVGMHRSGTTMLSEALEKLGVFMGARKDANSEALFFQNLNKWMFQSANANWDYPQPFIKILEDKKLIKMYAEYLTKIINSPRIISYLGLKRYLNLHGSLKNTFIWGWKDPRNTFTLPIWMEVFKNAYIIHVRRHGIDVAMSLFKRNEKSRKMRLKRYYQFRNSQFIYPIRPKKGGFMYSVRCKDIEGAFGLWVEYMEQIDRLYNKDHINILDIKYEDILSQPMLKLKNIAQYCNMEFGEERLEKAFSNFNKNRAYAFKNDISIKKRAIENQKLLKIYGYEDDI